MASATTNLQLVAPAAATRARARASTTGSISIAQTRSATRESGAVNSPSPQHRSTTTIPGCTPISTRTLAGSGHNACHHSASGIVDAGKKPTIMPPPAHNMDGRRRSLGETTSRKPVHAGPQAGGARAGSMAQHRRKSEPPARKGERAGDAAPDGGDAASDAAADLRRTRRSAGLSVCVGTPARRCPRALSKRDGGSVALDLRPQSIGGRSPAISLGLVSPALATLGETREGLPNVRFIDDVGIEVWATPIDHLGMALVLGVGHGFKVFGITPRTAHVFGGTSSL